MYYSATPSKTLPKFRRHQPGLPRVPITLTALRALVPANTRITATTALAIAGKQADALVGLHAARDGSRLPISESLITGIRRLRVIDTDQRLPGSHAWNTTTRQFNIELAKTEAPERRFALTHEFKHILDYGRTAQLYADSSIMSAAELSELAADFFAANFLVPTQWLTAAWNVGTRTTKELARLFLVSEHVIRDRLEQTGLASGDGSPSSNTNGTELSSPTPK